MSCFENTVDPEQMASDEAIWSGSTMFFYHSIEPIITGIVQLKWYGSRCKYSMPIYPTGQDLILSTVSPNSVTWSLKWPTSIHPFQLCLQQIELEIIWAVTCDFQQCGILRFPTMWYMRPAKPQISLHIRAVRSEPFLVALIFYDY